MFNKGNKNKFLISIEHYVTDVTCGSSDSLRKVKGVCNNEKYIIKLMFVKFHYVIQFHKKTRLCQTSLML